MKVKICGITRYQDAKLALDCGAWAIGLNFYPPSDRYLRPEDAAALLRKLPRDTLSVGIFVDAPLEAVNVMVEAVGLRAVQLHGEEPPDYAARVRAEVVIKAFPAGSAFRPERMEEYPGALILLDAEVPGKAGGTGRTCDWNAAREAARRRAILLAGGLTADNVGAAIAAVVPEGIDVASGVEESPGLKDAEKVRRLFREVERAAPPGAASAGRKTERGEPPWSS